jgi:hypothetical protein
MKRALAHIFTLTFTIGFIGCGAGPEKVCDHLVKLAEKSAKSKNPRKQAVKFSKSRAECITELTGLKTMDSDKYEAFSKCALGEAESLIYATRTCSDEVGMKPHLEDRVAPDDSE